MAAVIEYDFSGIFLPDTGKEIYFLISNSDRKVWYIPNHNTRIALELYQPGSFKGKFLKIFFPVLKYFSFNCRLVGIAANRYEINSGFSDLMCRLFKTNEIDISMFGGTPSVHQKMTVQISNGKRILGYCKVSENKEINTLFIQEEAMLKELRSCGITQIPECLYCGNGINGANLFVQTTTKTIHSKVFHSLSAIHWEFLNQLYHKTKKKLPFEKTDFYQSLQSLKQNLNYLSVFNLTSIESAIGKAEKFYSGRLVEFSVFHADFTPWNTFIENGELFVFDWEYSKRTFPPFLDAFHFFTQSGIFEKNESAFKIYKLYKSQKNQFRIFVDEPDILFISYLLSVISFYTERENGLFDLKMSDRIQIWIEMLTYLLKEN